MSTHVRYLLATLFLTGPAVLEASNKTPESISTTKNSCELATERPILRQYDARTAIEELDAKLYEGGEEPRFKQDVYPVLARVWSDYVVAMRQNDFISMHNEFPNHISASQLESKILSLLRVDNLAIVVSELADLDIHLQSRLKPKSPAYFSFDPLIFGGVYGHYDRDPLNLEYFLVRCRRFVRPHDESQPQVMVPFGLARAKSLLNAIQKTFSKHKSPKFPVGTFIFREADLSSDLAANKFTQAIANLPISTYYPTRTPLTFVKMQYPYFLHSYPADWSMNYGMPVTRSTPDHLYSRVNFYRNILHVAKGHLSAAKYESLLQLLADFEVLISGSGDFAL